MTTIKTAVLVLDDDADYARLVGLLMTSGGSADNVNWDGATVIRGGSWLGRVIRFLVRCAGPYSSPGT